MGGPRWKGRAGLKTSRRTVDSGGESVFVPTTGHPKGTSAVQIRPKRGIGRVLSAPQSSGRRHREKLRCGVPRWRP